MSNQHLQRLTCFVASSTALRVWRSGGTPNCCQGSGCSHCLLGSQGLSLSSPHREDHSSGPACLDHHAQVTHQSDTVAMGNSYSSSGEITWIQRGLPHGGERVGSSQHFGICFRGERSVPFRKRGPGIRAGRGQGGPGWTGGATGGKARDDGTDGPLPVEQGRSVLRENRFCGSGHPRPPAHRVSGGPLYCLVCNQGRQAGHTEGPQMTFRDGKEAPWSPDTLC